MKSMRPSILYFGETEYPFIRSSIAGGTIEVVGEPSELMEAVKREAFPIIIFDYNYPLFTESFVTRVYRRSLLSEFWLINDHENHNLPAYMIDFVFSLSARKSEFVARVKSSLFIKGLLDEYGMIGKSSGIKQVAEMVSQVAPTDISTLIIGPSGSGKELTARAIHRYSRRADKPFVAINCGALAENLLESELFGHERGAFTGAVGKREGLFKRADGGTVFLDEIGETTPALQVKLLRVLEDGSFYRVGGNDLVKADVRIVAATNRDLGEAISEREFREDLYFRIGAIRINLTGLAQRQADIIPLINHFFIEQTGQARGISQRAMELLISYGWPGNVRQLRNFVSRMQVSAEEGELSEVMIRRFFEEQGYTERHLPVVTDKSSQEAEFQLIYQALLSMGQEVRMLRDLILHNLPSRSEAGEGGEFERPSQAKTMEDMEAEMIRRTLDAVGGNRREAARRLGIGERTLYRKLKKYELEKDTLT
ncbi:MAG: sigma-54-dependent Fis family transcriptional regulator [FCB group bacterium]|nr:sigma-54-dependent Fis family transcriptional regulator [FCB group bacterium]